MDIIKIREKLLKKTKVYMKGWEKHKEQSRDCAWFFAHYKCGTNEKTGYNNPSFLTLNCIIYYRVVCIFRIML